MTVQINNFRLRPAGAASMKLPHATKVNRGRIRLVLLAAVRVFFSTRRDTALEVLAWRQQLAVLKRKRPRPPLNCFDRLFWTTLRRLWPRWADLLVIVKPETDIAWRRVVCTGVGSVDRMAGGLQSRRKSGA